MRSRCLVVYVPGDIYARLERLAAREDRDVVQQARHILRKALMPPAPPAPPAADTAVAPPPP